MGAVGCAEDDGRGHTSNIGDAGSDWMPEVVDGTKPHVQDIPSICSVCGSAGLGGHQI
jgi:hypothetical protein